MPLQNPQTAESSIESTAIVHLIRNRNHSIPLIMSNFPTTIRDLFFDNLEMPLDNWNSFRGVITSPDRMEIVIDVDYVLLHASALDEYGDVCPRMLQLLEKVHNLNIPLYAITSLSRIELDAVCGGMSWVFTQQLKASDTMMKFRKIRAHHRELHYSGKATLMLVGDELADLADLNHEWFQGDHLFLVNYRYQRETLNENVLTVAVMYAQLYLHSKQY